MALRQAIANGLWSAATTWTGGTIPGTGDEADMNGFVVRMKDNRTVRSITFGLGGSELILQPTAASAAIILTFDDAAGAGINAVGNTTSFIRIHGSVNQRGTIQSAVSPPVTPWVRDPNFNLPWDLWYATVRDFNEFTSANFSSWATMAFNSTFIKTSGANVGAYARDKQVFDTCVFSRVDFGGISGAADNRAAVITNSSFNYGSTFGSFAAATASVVISRVHNRSANDYRVWAGTTGDTAASGGSMSVLRSAMRPASNDNIRIVDLNNSAHRVRWDLASTVATFQFQSIIGTVSGTNKVNIPNGTILTVRGTMDDLTTSSGLFVLNQTGIIKKQTFTGSRLELWCGGRPAKSVYDASLTFSSTVELVIATGTFLVDNALTARAIRVQDYWPRRSPGYLSVSSGVTLTIQSAGTVTLWQADAWALNGTSGSRVLLRASQFGSTAYLNIERGRRIIADGAKNFAFQNFDGPLYDYWRAGRKSRLAYMDNTSGAAAGRWKVITYDWAAAAWGTTVQFDTVNTHAGDGHRYPVVMHDNAGTVHIFYAAHNDPLRHARANSTNSILSFTLATNLSDSATYPNLLKTTAGTFYLSYRRTSPRTWFRTSTNNMNTWTVGTVIHNSAPGAGLAYDLTYPNGGMTLGTNLNGRPQVIHWFGSFRMFTDAVSTGRDPWYVRSTDGGTNWRTANGTVLTLPIVPATSGSPFRMKAHAFAGTIDEAGNPHLFINAERRSPTASAYGYPYQLWHLYHNGTTWASNLVSTATAFANWGYHADSDRNGRLYLTWDATDASYGIAGGTTLSALNWNLAVSIDLGTTWTTERLRRNPAVTAPSANFSPGYTYGRWVDAESKFHVFWTALTPGPPAPTTNASFYADVRWEEYAPAPGQSPYLLQAVDVRDFSSTGPKMYSPTSNSVDSGRNSNWVFFGGGADVGDARRRRVYRGRMSTRQVP